jgi:hypothetical protein
MNTKYDEDDRRHNGYVRWPALVTSSISLLSIMVIVTIFAGNQAIAIDERSVRRDEMIQRQIVDFIQQNSIAHEKILELTTSISLDVRELKTKAGIITQR